jgi:hypothetical protein
MPERAAAAKAKRPPVRAVVDEALESWGRWLVKVEETGLLVGLVADGDVMGEGDGRGWEEPVLLLLCS